MTAAVTRIGEWGRARRLLAGAGARLQRGVAHVLRDQADRAREAIVEGIERQAPGGRPFRPPAASTLAARALLRRASQKALFERGELEREIVKVVERERAFVGVRRAARGRDGRPLAVIGQLHEIGGTVRVRITPAMRRFLFAAARARGNVPSRARDRRGNASTHVVVQVPARPFLRPSFALAVRDARPRVLGQLGRALGWR